MKRYILPVLTGILIYLFYAFLPLLKTCSLSAPLRHVYNDVSRRLKKRDLILMLLITSAYGITAFTGLGDKFAPQTFISFPDEYLDFYLEGSSDVNYLMLYTGVGSGSYSVGYSSDGIYYEHARSFEQNHAAVLKWHRLEIPELNGNSYLRLYSYGSSYLGEIALLDADFNVLNIRAVTDSPNFGKALLLTDEQALICTDQTYLNSSYFDEIYHARTAWENLNGVYPYEVSHPPLGKIIIAIGVSVFGMTPFGWRFSGTLAGILMLPLIYFFAKKMFGGKTVPICCTVILASDFMHFTQTRIATIDSFAVLFIMVMYLFMYLYINTDRLHYLALCGIFFGIGAATKWTCIYAGIGLAFIWAIHWFEHREAGFSAFVKNSLFCVLFFIIIPVAIYYVSYIPYAVDESVTPVFSKAYAKLVLDNQRFMLSYHSKLVATHPYSSVWYQWILDIRPILYYLKYFDNGTRSSFGAWVNPVLCWGGLISLFLMVYTAVARRDKNAFFILTAYASQLLPWVFITRLTFEYHYFPCTVFLCLGFGYVFSIHENSGTKRAYLNYAVTGLAVICFILFYPVLSGIPVNPVLATNFLKWLPTWPF